MRLLPLAAAEDAGYLMRNLSHYNYRRLGRLQGLKAAKPDDLAEMIEHADERRRDVLISMLRQL